MRASFVAAASLVLLLAATVTRVEAQSAAQLHADSLLGQQQWRDAATAYAAVTAAEPANGAAWTNLGESLLQQRKFDEAIAALRPVILGATSFTHMANEARWKSLVAQLVSCGAAPYRQFDFWVGEWDVNTPQGAMAGHNVVTLEQDGCLLVEHWTSSAGGSTGTSFNYYDIRDRKWHQLYIDNSGNAGAFPAMAGGLTDGRMVMLTEDTNNVQSRWTWYVMEPGKVRQMAERSTDHGKTWQTTWDSVYLLQKTP